MTWAVFLNNQTVRQIFLLPNGAYRGITRYIFIEGRDIPIILTDEASATVPQNWAVGVTDGTNPHYQLGYEGGGKIEIRVEVVNDILQYTASSGFAEVALNL